MKRRVAILISGRGSNMAALVEAARAQDFPAEIVVVISNKADAPGLAKARNSGVPAVTIESKPFGKERAGFEAKLQSALDEYRVDLICLGGFMRLFTAGFVQRWHGRMLNIHPSLLPSFPGLDVQKKAIDWGCKLAGCTVHFVTEGVDEGPIVLQAAVPVLDHDTPEILAARILEQEHKIYPRAVQLFAEGRLRVDGRRVLIDQGKPAGDAIISPS